MYPEDPDLLTSEDEQEYDAEQQEDNEGKADSEDNSGNADDDDNDDDENDEKIQLDEEKITEIQKKITENPYMYEEHVQLIDLFRKGGELDRLRKAREDMATYFPLTPEMWMQWTSDELSLLIEGSDRGPVYKLFERAVSDYQDVDLWLEYCQLAIGGMGTGSPEELDGVRRVFEKALANQGLNFARGALLWELFREFETIVFVQMQGSSTNPAELTAQFKKIDNIFRRQLNIPHQGMEATMQEYSTFLTDLGAAIYPLDEGGERKEADVPAEVMAAFTRASAKMVACQPFEDRIELLTSSQEGDNQPAALLNAWGSYLDFAIQSASQKVTKAMTAKRQGPDAPSPPLTPQEVICLLERAITANCLEPAIWIKMADFLETHVAADVDRLVSTLARAVRNTPWSGPIWRRYALASEYQAWKQITSSSSTPNFTNSENGSGADVPPGETPLSRALKHTEAIYETAVNCSFNQPADLLLVWTSYCDFWLRRLLQSSPEDAEIKKQWIVESLQQTFERAITHTEAAFGAQGDPECSLLRYWAFVEVKHIGDSGRAQSLWTRMMKMSGNGTKPSFWIAYLEFEKCLGDLKHLLRVAGMAINSVTGEFTETVFQTASRALIEAGVDLQRLQEFEIKLRNRRLHMATLKPKLEQAEEAGQGGKKSMKGGRREDHKDQAPLSSTRKRNADDFTVKTESSPKKTRSDAAVHKVSATEKGDPEKDTPKHGEYVTHDPSKDDRTVFVSNLPFKLVENDLKDIFKKCGEISAIRLVRNFTGKSKGFGYVEFNSSTSAQAALEMDRFPIHSGDGDQSGIGRPMYVSICDPNRSKGSKQFAYSTGKPEPKKLFVRNLGKQVREDAIRNFFGMHGTVVNVRLATFRNGAPKGNAYVEFATEEDASKALVATDGVVFGGDAPLQVAISNPPLRAEGEGSQFSLAADSASSGPTVRSHTHSQLSFMPRALHRTGPSTSVTSSNRRQKPTDIAAPITDTPKSNDDFRKMFFK